MITVNGVLLPAPKAYSVSLQDLDGESTGRSETGRLQRDRIRAGVYKIEATWMVTKTDLKKITDALAPASFTVIFFDPTKSSDTTATMYAGDRTGGLVVLQGESWWELSVNLIEY